MSERNRKSSQYVVVGAIAVAFLVTSGIGCAKTDSAKESADTPVAAAADTIVPDTVAPDPGLNGKPDDDPAKTRDYLAMLNPLWATIPFKLTFRCHDDDCAGNPAAHIAVYTHKLTSKFNAVKVLDRSGPDTVAGHILMKLVNLDPFAIKPLGLQPGDTAYLWAGKTNRERAYAVFKIDQNGYATGVARAYSAYYCSGMPDRPSPTVHVTASEKCEEPGATTLELYHDVEPPEIRGLATPFHNQGTWLGCEPSGCCQMKTFGSYQ